MALQSSGAISLSQIAAEFSDSAPHRLAADFYGAAAGVPGSGAISMSNFYGKSAVVVPVPAYNSIDRSISSINEDGAQVCTFTVNAAELASGTTVGWSVLGTSTANATDIQLSYDGSNWLAGANSGTLTLDFSAQNFKLYIRALADNTTEGAQNWSFQLAGTDSNSVSTGGLARGVTINDTSLDPATFPTGTDVTRQFDGTYNSNTQDVSTYVTYGKNTSAGNPEGNIFYNFRATSSGWSIRAASGIGHTFQHYTPAGSLTSVPTSPTAGLDYQPYTAQTGTVTPDAIKYKKTLVQDASVGLMNIAGFTTNVGAMPPGDNPIPGTYQVNPDVWQAVSTNQSFQFTHFGAGTFVSQAGGVGGFDSLYKIELWARKAGYDDTLVATYLSRIYATDTHQPNVGGGGGGGEEP